MLVRVIIIGIIERKVYKTGNSSGKEQWALSYFTYDFHDGGQRALILGTLCRLHMTAGRKGLSYSILIQYLIR